MRLVWHIYDWFCNKNLQVEYEVAKQLSSKQIPVHLCKSHDVTNISTLGSIIKSKIGLWEKIEKRDQVWSNFFVRKNPL